MKTAIPSGDAPDPARAVPTRLMSFQASLLRSFALLTLLSAAVVFVLDLIREQQTKSELSQRLVQRGAEHIAERFANLLAEAELGARILATSGVRSDLHEEVRRVTALRAGEAPDAAALAAAARLNVRLMYYLLNQPNVSSVQLANDLGTGFLVLQLAQSRFRNRIVNRQAWGARVLWLELDELGEVVSHSWEDSDYDPRTRPWYVGLSGVAAGEIRWTEPGRMYATGDFGMTAAAWWQRDGVRWVCALDVLLHDITRFTQAPAMAFTANGLSAVFTADWRIVGLPRLERYAATAQKEAVYLTPVTEVGSRALVESLRSVEPLALGDVKAVRLGTGDETWWAGVAKFPVAGTNGFLILVVVPDDDLLLGVAKSRDALVLAVLLALSVAIGVAIWLARSFSRPLAVLGEASRRIEALDFREGALPNTRLKEIQDLAGAQRRSLVALESFSRYVPMSIVRELVRRGEVARIGGTEHDVTALFTDVAGFTAIAERLGAKATANHLASYFDTVIEAIESRQGTVDKFMGDGIVAFWGAPYELRNSSWHALDAVLATRLALGRVELEWRSRGLPALPTRFGLAAGQAIVGNMGSQRRLAYTAVGDPINLASRLEGLNKLFGTVVLADAVVHDRAGEDFAWRRIDRVRVLGRNEPVVAYELLGRRTDVPAGLVQRARRYESAWDLYAQGRFAEALHAFAELDEVYPGDGATARMIALCRAFDADPPATGWMAVSDVVAK
jgi:adenylate cyclase